MNTMCDEQLSWAPILLSGLILQRHIECGEPTRLDTAIHSL